MNINSILKSKTLAELLDAIDDFCRNSFIRENDDEIMNLKEQVDEITDNDYIVMLSAYMCAAEDGDEVIEALYEFVSNCKGFVEPDEDLTQQVTKEEFEEVLNECEDKCAIMSCIEENHTINVAEVPMYNIYREFGLRFKNNAINLFLPKIDINTDTKKFIGEELGIILYKVLTEEFTPDYIRHEMNRYIGESRNREEPTKELFKEYFYQVVLYKERKPGIYLEIDDHMRRIFVLEFFKRIIREYIEKKEGKSSAKSCRVFTQIFSNLIELAQMTVNFL